MADANGPTHFRPDEDCAQLTTRFLGIYTQCEGLVEDIGHVYLSGVPEGILNVLVLRRPWSTDTVKGLLKAVLERESFDDVPNIFKRIGPGRTYAFVAEWKWATDVRNDLAHATGDADHAGRWHLKTRSSRHTLTKLPETVTSDELCAHVVRLYELQGALIELGSHLGLRDWGWEGLGPVPVS